MTRHRTIFFRSPPVRHARLTPLAQGRSLLPRATFVSLSLAVALATLPAGALAGSLLSGYGGPGGGAQAILGSTLVNGSGGGSNGGGSGGGVSGGGAAPAAVGTSSYGQGKVGGSAQARAAAHRAAGAARSTGGVQGRHGAARSSSSNGASAGAPSTYTYSDSSRTAATLAAAEEGGPLGLSGTDLLLIALAIGALVFTTGLTRRLARTQH
jgi:hypothetical protein